MADLASPDRHITAKDMECLKEAFALFDRDRDGEINTEELGKVNITWNSYQPNPRASLLGLIKINFIFQVLMGNKYNIFAQIISQDSRHLSKRFKNNRKKSCPMDKVTSTHIPGLKASISKF